MPARLTAELTVEPEAPDSGPLASIAALSAQITLVYATPVGGVEVEGPDDYVGIVKQAWNIVNAEYVRGNFNGVDWDAVYDEYVIKAEDLNSSEELWILLAELIRELKDDHSRFVPPENMGAQFGIETRADAELLPATGIVIWPGPSREDEYLFIYIYECASSSSRTRPFDHPVPSGAVAGLFFDKLRVSSLSRGVKWFVYLVDF